MDLHHQNGSELGAGFLSPLRPSPHFGLAMGFNPGGENERRTMNPLSRLNNAAPPILSGLLLACLPLAPIAHAVDPPQERGRPTAILVSPIHEAQVVRGDDGKAHVE